MVTQVYVTLKNDRSKTLKMPKQSEFIRIKMNQKKAKILKRKNNAPTKIKIDKSSMFCGRKFIPQTAQQKLALIMR